MSAPDQPYGDDVLPPEYRPRRRAATWTVGKAIGATIAVVLGVLAIAIVTVITLNPQRVADQIAVWNFEPSAEIVAYADSTAMTDEARFLFYAGRPVVAADEEFDAACTIEEVGIGVLGCYLPGPNTIYLYDVTDDRLAGIEEVTAAHEMLHAVWDRMPDEERASLEVLLEAEAEAVADDPAFAERFEFYARTEPGERSNELHSIVGTEFAVVGEELEKHYARYFTDRAQVVALHEQSNAVFVEQQAEIESLVARLDGLRASIEADYASYNSSFDVLTGDIAVFNDRAESGFYSSQSAFAADRDELIRRQDELDAFFASIEAKRVEFDQLATSLDALNAEVESLNDSINITPRDEVGL